MSEENMEQPGIPPVPENPQHVERNFLGYLASDLNSVATGVVTGIVTATAAASHLIKGNDQAPPPPPPPADTDSQQ